MSLSIRNQLGEAQFFDGVKGDGGGDLLPAVQADSYVGDGFTLCHDDDNSPTTVMNRVGRAPRAKPGRAGAQACTAGRQRPPCRVGGPLAGLV
jgi:hypothetical protein